MKKTPINQPLYTEELEKLQLEQIDKEVHQLIEDDIVPSAHELMKYNQLLPNGADRILTLIEQEKKHRRKIEKNKLDINSAVRIFKMAFGFVLGLLTVIAVLNSKDSRLVLALLWASTVIALGTIFSSFLKDKFKGGGAEQEY